MADACRTGLLGDGPPGEKIDTSAGKTKYGKDTNAIPDSHPAAALTRLGFSRISYNEHIGMMNQWALSATLKAFFFDNPRQS